MITATAHCSPARESRETTRAKSRLSRGGLRTATEAQEATP